MKGSAAGTAAPGRDIRSPRPLHAGRYPDSTFWAGTLSHDRDRWMLAGELTVRQAASPVTLATEPVEPAGDGFHARATARIDRYAYGVTAAKGRTARHLDIAVTAVAQPL